MTLLPCIHINGTSPITLRDDYIAASDALYQAMRAFDKIEFNSRDYYPLGDRAWSEARANRQIHADALANARAYLMEHAEHAADAIRP